MPNEAQAATGANAGPTILPSIDTCAAGMLAMFQSRFGETAAHGSSGQPYFLFSARFLLSFCRIEESFADPEEGGTGSACTSRASARYCASASLFPAQYASQACLASIQVSVPSWSCAGSSGASLSTSPS